MDFTRTEKPRRAISIIPLIDISLFLLIFFMVAGTIEKIDLIPIEPPTASSGKLMDEGHIVILLGTHEEIVMDEELVTLEELGRKLTKILSQHPDKIITLKADASIPAQRMIRVMDSIKLAGGKHLSIATLSTEGENDAE